MIEEEVQSRRRGVIVLLVVVAVGLAVWFGATTLAGFARGAVAGGPSTTRVDLPAGTPVEVNVPPGSSARSIAALLEREGVIGSALEFEVAARSEGVAGSLAAGTYELTAGMSVEDAIAVLVEGPVVETYSLIVREGLRIEEVLDTIAEQSAHSVAELETALISGEVDSMLLPPGEGDELTDWEGLLFPATYDFVPEASPSGILQRLAREMDGRVSTLDLGAWEAEGYTPYEALVMASIVEAETRVDDDRPLVASVIANRLEQGMPLQIDATVLYAMGERGVGLTLSDLEIDSPYNTYQNLGLPPTPIGVPGQASLDAVADPPATDYLYYVLTSADGTHSFTANYDEFLRWKEQAQAEGLFP